MADEVKTQLVSGGPVTGDHLELKSNGQQKDYVVLAPDERLKGFVRPLRTTYKHIGKRPKHPTRELTDDEKQRYSQFGYALFEKYPESSGLVGKFWTQAELESGCSTTTTMSLPIAETYARNPKFYSGTFCVHCRKHLPLDEFVWDGTAEQVGS